MSMARHLAPADFDSLPGDVLLIENRREYPAGLFNRQPQGATQQLSHRHRLEVQKVESRMALSRSGPSAARSVASRAARCRRPVREGSRWHVLARPAPAPRMVRRGDRLLPVQRTGRPGVTSRRSYAEHPAESQTGRSATPLDLNRREPMRMSSARLQPARRLPGLLAPGLGTMPIRAGSGRPRWPARVSCRSR